ncbi:unnamed protein product [Urochloa humidicola]
MHLNLIDDILVLILHRIDSPASLIRAASTCKQWHAIISSAAFLRRFRSARSSSLVAGDYFNDHKSNSSPMTKYGHLFCIFGGLVKV